MANGGRISGSVKWFSDEKGYGFIVRDDGEKDVFVHFRGIEGQGRKTLVAGQKVTFEIIQGPKGEQASKVRAV